MQDISLFFINALPKKFTLGSMNRTIFICIFFLNIMFITAIYAEDIISENVITEDNITEEENITTFTENWTLSLFSNYNIGIFTQADTSQYRTNKPWDIGFGIRYKIFSFKTSFSMPVTNTSLDFDFDVTSYFDRAYFEAYFKYYQDFYTISTNEPGGLDTLSAGLMATFVQNYRNHSISSVIKLDKKQNISSGSLLYGLGLFLMSLDSASETINNRDGRQNLIYFGPGIGYSYIWVFENGFFLNASVILLTNAGINISTDKWLFIPHLEPNFVLGYHQTKWSVNIKVINKTTVIVWDTASQRGFNGADFNLLTLMTIALTFSKRF
jgi:hypothetical protein